MDYPKKIIAFDIQGVLIDTDEPEDALAMQTLLRRLKRSGHTIIVWTSDTKEYATEIVTQLNLIEYVDSCRSKFDGGIKPDIAFDDNPVVRLLAREPIVLN